MVQFWKTMSCVAVMAAIVCVLMGELLLAFLLTVGGVAVWISAMISEGP